MADAGARRRRLVLTDAVRDGHLAIFVKREVHAGVLALQNGENPPALVVIAIATFLFVTTAAFFVFGLALAATWVLIGGAMLAVTLGGRDGLELFGSLMYMLAVFLWGNVACGVLRGAGAHSLRHRAGQALPRRHPRFGRATLTFPIPRRPRAAAARGRHVGRPGHGLRRRRGQARRPPDRGRLIRELIS